MAFGNAATEPVKDMGIAVNLTAKTVIVGFFPVTAAINEIDEAHVSFKGYDKDPRYD